MQSRVFIGDSLLLQKYANTYTDNSELANYLDSDLDILLKLLKTHCPVLADLIEYHEKNIPCMSTCATLFKDLLLFVPY